MVLPLCEDDSAYPFLYWQHSHFFAAAFVVFTQHCVYQEPMHQNALLQAKRSEREGEVMSQWKMNIGGQTVAFTATNTPHVMYVCVHVFATCVCVCIQAFMDMSV